MHEHKPVATCMNTGLLHNIIEKCVCMWGGGGGKDVPSPVHNIARKQIFKMSFFHSGVATGWQFPCFVVFTTMALVSKL